MKSIRRRDYRKLGLVGLLVFVTVFVFTLSTQSNTKMETEAASLAGFDPGYIISDYQMGNYNSMTEAEIQAFLDSKATCDKGADTYKYVSTTWPSIKWHFKDDHIVCLKEELFGDGETIGEGETAAHIIWRAAQDYKINPQVIIVLLQKEQGLITDSYPNNRQYRSATGYGCPDTAVCNTKYYGLKNQVRQAAALFRAALDGQSRYYPIGVNNIRYSPNAACGATQVTIKNYATSALYRYTPYTPNAAALAAGSGSGDACSSYGNRNFYLYFEDWFGGITLESGYIALDSPRYFELKVGADRINSYTGEVVDTLPTGLVRKYDSKIKLGSGEWCLRTEFSTAADSDACIKMSNLSEIMFEYEDVDEKKIITPKSEKIDMRSDSVAMKFTDYIIRRFTKKVTFLDKTYYITEFDALYNDSRYGILEDTLFDSYEVFTEAKDYILNEDTSRVNPFTDEVIDTLQKGRIIKIMAKIKLDEKVYYQTENNYKNNISAAILSDALVELGDYGYESFINPREMVLTKDVERINPFTGSIIDRLEKGRTIKFASKIYINGAWYYRTENNTNNNINAAIPASAVMEKK